MKTTSMNDNDLPTTSRQTVSLVAKIPQRKIFESPFFEVIDQSADYQKFNVRCYTCGEQMRVHIHNTKSAKYHLEKSHPKLFEMYEKKKRKRTLIRKFEYKKWHANSSDYSNLPDNYIVTLYKREIQNTIENGIRITSTSCNNASCELLSTRKKNISLSSKTIPFIAIKERLIYTPPFFQIVNVSEDTVCKFVSRCYNCGKLLFCGLNQSSSNLQAHLKRCHPLIYKLHDKCKTLDIYPNEEYDSSYSPGEILSLIEKYDQEPNSRPNRNERLVLLFAPPYFEIILETVKNNNLTARCCTCGELISAWFNCTLRLKHHLENHHPQLCKIYDRYKIFLYYSFKKVIPENNKQGSVKLTGSTNKSKRLNEYQPKRSIFTPPYFEVRSQTADNKTFNLSCYTCGEEMCINNTITAQNHLKRHHPDIFTMYKNNKWKFLNNKFQTETFQGVELLEKKNSTLSKNVLTPDKYINTPMQKSMLYLQSKMNSKKPQNKKFIFTSQFFKLVHKHEGGKLVRCYTCGKLMKAYCTYSLSRLTQHIQRNHPDLFKLYKKSRRKPVSSYLTNTYNNEHKNNIIKELFQTNKNKMAEGSTEQDMLELSDSNLQDIEVLIDDSLKNLVKQTGYFELKNKVMEMVVENKNINTSSILELKSDIEKVKKECIQLQLDVHKFRASKNQLQNDIKKLYNFLHERKLIIRNIQISNKRQPLKDVENLLKFKLNLHKVKVLNCSIITSQTSSKNSNTETVLVELLNAKDCNLVLSQNYKLNDTGIVIEPELSSRQLKYRNKLMVLRKELLNRNPDLKVLVHKLTLVVNGENFYWDDTEGLYYDSSSAEAMEITGVEYLNKLTGLDLREIVRIIQKYEIKV